MKLPILYTKIMIMKFTLRCLFTYFNVYLRLNRSHSWPAQSMYCRRNGTKFSSNFFLHLCSCTAVLFQSILDQKIQFDRNQKMALCMPLSKDGATENTLKQWKRCQYRSLPLNSFLPPELHLHNPPISWFFSLPAIAYRRHILPVLWRVDG